MPNREGNRETNFSNFKRRNRNLNFLSPVLGRERNLTKYISIYEREKRNLKFYSLISRVEREK